MKIRVYADKETEQIIRQAMKEADGHCPCVFALARNEDTKCMCKEFREAPAGTVCHCGLYEKIEE